MQLENFAGEQIPFLFTERLLDWQPRRLRPVVLPQASAQGFVVRLRRAFRGHGDALLLVQGNELLRGLAIQQLHQCALSVSGLQSTRPSRGMGAHLAEVDAIQEHRFRLLPWSGRRSAALSLGSGLRPSHGIERRRLSLGHRDSSGPRRGGPWRGAAARSRGHRARRLPRLRLGEPVSPHEAVDSDVAAGLAPPSFLALPVVEVRPAARVILGLGPIRRGQGHHQHLKLAAVCAQEGKTMSWKRASVRDGGLAYQDRRCRPCQARPTAAASDQSAPRPTRRRSQQSCATTSWQIRRTRSCRSGCCPPA